MIKDTIYNMMITNTGKHMCDSGFGERGRAWQRNQIDYPTLADIEKSPVIDVEQPEQWYTLKDSEGQFVRRFKSEAEVKEYIKGDNRMYTIEKEKLDSSDIFFAVNIYHHLIQSLEVDELCEQFNALECKDWDSDKAYGISEKQAEWLEDHRLSFGDMWNSYNVESNLSQTLQGCNMNLQGNESNFEFPEYILLQIHQGADVRGGYTDAKLFKVIAEYFDVNPTVYGDIDGVPVSTGYDGNTLTRDDDDGMNGEVIPVTPDSVIILELSEY